LQGNLAVARYHIRESDDRLENFRIDGEAALNGRWKSHDSNGVFPDGDLWSAGAAACPLAPAFVKQRMMRWIRVRSLVAGFAIEFSAAAKDEHTLRLEVAAA
jgi:hypothetical protein